MASKGSIGTGTGSKLTMNLLVNSKTQRVLYTEAGKDVVDFLFSLLTLPVGTVVKLLTADTMAGSLGNLYGSVKKLDDRYYISRDGAKKALLSPAAVCDQGGNNLLRLEAAPPACFYRCSSNNAKTYSNCRNYVTKLRGAKCRNCDWTMNTKLVEVVDPAADGAVGAAAGAGFVQEIVTYTVMDDLTVNPMSYVSGITLLNSFGVTDIGSLQEKTVQLGYDEGLEILKASLQSKTVLTDVFLAKKPKR